MALPLLAWIGIGLAGWGGYSLLHKPRFLGDVAKVGDIVYVAPSFLSQTTIPNLPPGTLYVGVKVKGEDKERVQGPIVAYGDMMLAGEAGSFTVQRKDVFKVTRDGKTIAFQPGATIGADG